MVYIYANRHMNKVLQVFPSRKLPRAFCLFRALMFRQKILDLATLVRGYNVQATPCAFVLCPCYSDPVIHDTRCGNINTLTPEHVLHILLFA